MITARIGRDKVSFVHLAAGLGWGIVSAAVANTELSRSLATALLTTLVGLGCIGWGLNNLFARVALVEVMLNEGLPPGLGIRTGITSAAAFDPVEAADLGEGIHIFVSRSCSGCKRLLADLARSRAEFGDHDVFVHYLGRAGHADKQAAYSFATQVEENTASLAASIGATPVPHTLVVADSKLLARSVTSSAAAVRSLALQAGFTRAPTRTQSELPATP